MKEKNDCYKCKFRDEVPGSVHSSCGVFDGKSSVTMATMAMLGKIPKITDTNTGEDLVKCNPLGVANGWCNFPLDFDPVWVECYLPIGEEEKEEVSHD